MTADRPAITERVTVPAVLAAFVLAIGIVFALLAALGDDEPELTPQEERAIDEELVAEVAAAWLDAWSAHDTEAMAALTDGEPASVERTVTSFREGMGIGTLRVSPRPPEVRGGRALVAFDAAADLDGSGTWTFSGELSLVLAEDWQVAWSRRVLHPALTGERRLRTALLEHPRAQLLAADGAPLTGPGAAPPPALASQLVRSLDAAFDADLRGVADAEIRAVEVDGTERVLEVVRGRPPAPVRTSIDLGVQAAAEAVLGAVTQPGAIVAIRPSTGEVVAAVSNPVQGFNRALSGRYPPGSTFKVITSTALLESGITPDTPTTCPEVATINGREFRNAEGAALGDIPFRRAFYESCNTAFVQLAAGIEASSLMRAAERFGFNVAPATEVPAEVPSFPEPHSVVDQASAAIGQGRVLATPLQMASVAATVASGVRRPATFRAVTSPPAGEPLPDGVAPTLQELMRLAVAQGTGTAAQLPGEPVAGKTGTAEFGTADPPRTHAWFIGFRGDIALAVVVEDGGFGGRVAAPLARDLLSRIS